MGATGATKFLALPEDASVGQTLNGNTVTGNYKFFTVSGKEGDTRPNTRGEAEMYIRQKVNAAYNDYQKLREYLRQEEEEKKKGKN